MQRSLPTEYAFLPQHFNLPRDAEAFRAAVRAHPRRLWIRKPRASSRGRGVGLVPSPRKLLARVAEARPSIVQQYVAKPHLIDGRKYDLRLFVAVTSFEPLRAYIYPDGLVRFATTPYSGSAATLKDKGMHLTNVAVNSQLAGYRPQTQDGTGSKWSLRQLWAVLERDGVDTAAVWQQLHALVAKTLIAVQPKVSAMVRRYLLRSWTGVPAES